MKLYNRQLISLKKLIYKDFKSQHDVEIGDLNNIIEATDYIVKMWVKQENIEIIGDETSNHCNDVDGNILNVGDYVIVLDCEDLEDCDILRGDILRVTNVDDPVSNYIKYRKDECDTEYGFYGHRVLRFKHQ
jgi:hypothetical protein